MVCGEGFSDFYDLIVEGCLGGLRFEEWSPNTIMELRGAERIEGVELGMPITCFDVGFEDLIETCYLARVAGIKVIVLSRIIEDIKEIISVGRHIRCDFLRWEARIIAVVVQDMTMD